MTYQFCWNFIKVVDPRKLDLSKKEIILHPRIAILLFKDYFGREKINFHEKNLKYRKIILLINFIFTLQISFSRKRFPTT